MYSNPDVWNDITWPSDAVKDELLSYIGKRLTPQPTKLRADVEVTCFGYEGIDAVKAALKVAEKNNTEDNQIKVRLVSPPLYVLTMSCLVKDAGIASLQAKSASVGSDIRAAFIDDADHAERRANAFDLQAIGTVPGGDDFADRIGKRCNGANSFGNSGNSRAV